MHNCLYVRKGCWDSEALHMVQQYYAYFYLLYSSIPASSNAVLEMSLDLKSALTSNLARCFDISLYELPSSLALKMLDLNFLPSLPPNDIERASQVRQFNQHLWIFFHLMTFRPVNFASLWRAKSQQTHR